MSTATVPPAPTDRHLDRLGTVLAPLARVTQPKLYGVDRIPDGGALFVGNHTIYGLIDLPFMMNALWQQRAIRVRGLGEHGHYAIPVWRDLLELSGMVRGTRDNVRALMRDRQDILVFPGGAGEVMKQRGQKYQLLWKERLGFARLAIEAGYPIVPFAAVGVEEMFDIVADDQTPGFAHVSALMKRLVSMPLPSITRGIGLTPLPRPERLYFHFGEPIDTTRFDRRADDDAAARVLRDEVRAAVEAGIEELQERRAADPKRKLIPRLLDGTADPPALATADPDAWFVTRALDAWNDVGPAGAAAWMSRRVTLTDPPGWPDAQTWRGRDAVIDRLEQVTSELGAGWVQVSDVHSESAEVIGLLDLRPDRRSRNSLGRFRLAARLDKGQIVAINASTQPAP